MIIGFYWLIGLVITLFTLIKSRKRGRLLGYEDALAVLVCWPIFIIISIVIILQNRRVE